MAMTGVLRPGHAQVRVLNLEESVHFYRNVLGLVETGRDKMLWLSAQDFLDTLLTRPGAVRGALSGPGGLLTELGAKADKAPVLIYLHGGAWASGSADIMIGRGLVACPDLAWQIACQQRGQAYQARNWTQMQPVVQQFFQLLCHRADSQYPQARLKQWLALVSRAFPAAQPLLRQVRQLTTVAALEATLAEPHFWND